jgi:hypothetical protein
MQSTDSFWKTTMAAKSLWENFDFRPEMLTFAA